jgi:hypothetical protein
MFAQKKKRRRKINVMCERQFVLITEKKEIDLYLESLIYDKL